MFEWAVTVDSGGTLSPALEFSHGADECLKRSQGLAFVAGITGFIVANGLAAAALWVAIGARNDAHDAIAPRPTVLEGPELTSSMAQSECRESATGPAIYRMSTDKAVTVFNAGGDAVDLSKVAYSWHRTEWTARLRTTSLGQSSGPSPMYVPIVLAPGQTYQLTASVVVRISASDPDETRDLGDPGTWVFEFGSGETVYISEPINALPFSFRSVMQRGSPTRQIPPCSN